jgi:hypothetical protein
MRRRTAQRFLIASGILLLLGGGSCFLSVGPYLLPGRAANWMAPLFAISGLGALGIAAILGLIGLIGLIIRRREPIPADLEKK